MKVLVVTNGFPPRGQWGTEFYTLQLVRGLRARGHDMAVLHADRSGRLPRFTVERVDEDGMPVFLVHNPGDPKKSFEDSYRSPEVEQCFRQVVEDWKPDVVHFTYLLWGLSVRMPTICKELGVPSVLTLTDYGLLCHRGQMYDWRLTRCEGPHPAEVCARCVREPSTYDDNRLRVAAKRAAVRGLAAVGGMGRVVTAPDLLRREAVVRETLDSADHLIAPTRVLREAFERGGVPEAKLSTLVYAIDERPLEIARVAPKNAGVRFGYLGQFTPHKGLGTLLEAVRILNGRLPESLETWDLRLYGAPSGGRHRRYADTIFSGDLGPRVKRCKPFPPTQAPQILAQLDAVIVPSEWDENAPLTILQARAAGVPVLVSDMAGIAEVVEEGVHGHLFPAGDAQALANLMGRAIVRGAPRIEETAPPVGLPEHIDRILEIYAGVRERVPKASGPARAK